MLDREALKHFISINSFGDRICRTAFRFVFIGFVVSRTFPSNGFFTMETFTKCMIIYE